MSNRDESFGPRPPSRSRAGAAWAAAAPALDALHGEGHLADIDLHFGRLIAELDGGGGPELPLAAALASAWTRDGHVCLALSEVAGRDWPRSGTGAARLPAFDAWTEVLGASPLVARPEAEERRPLVLDQQGRLYLERLWTAERAVADGLIRLAGDGTEPEPEGLDAALERFFPDAAPGDRPRAAARTAVRRRLCVVSGGPGTGKTTTVAAVVALLVEVGLAAPGRIALAAPTGKAAARLQEAVRERHRALAARTPALVGYEAEATTVHRWLRRAGRDGLPIDALILDEGSMVDLSLMAQVLAALPGDARLIVLGDASQLASVQPGAMFADLCRAGAGGAGAGVRKSGAGKSRVGAGKSPAGAGKSPVGTGESPAGTGESPAGTGESPAGTGESPAGTGESPAGTGESPAGTGESPAGTGESPAGTGVCDAGSGARPPLPEASPLAPCVVELVRNWRFDEAGGIGRLAAAVVRGDAPAALAALRDPDDPAIGLRPLSDPAAFERLAARFADERFALRLRAMQALREPGGEVGPLSSFQVLCAHRVGSFGAERFNRTVEQRLRALGLVRAHETFYPGRPILVTRNDPRTRLSNGDTGVVLRDAAGQAWVRFLDLTDADGGPRLVPPARLPPHESFFALTVHRAQGSEYDEVAVVPGSADSRVATRELLYTAVTRARRQVVVYGSAESVAAALGRATMRSSGLRDALTKGRAPA